MLYKKLGRTDLAVSAICLGTMTWGEQNTETEAHEQLDYALERGINFLDTAEMYPVPPRKETYSRTEEYIGRWDKLKTQREKIILATKVVGPMDNFEDQYIRGGKTKLNKEHIDKALEGSLKRLNVDYIDLYQLHWPERQTNFFGARGYTHLPEDKSTPIKETLQALKPWVDKGVIRHLGLSNETPWGVMQYLNAARELGMDPVVSIQNPYNLLNRTFEIGLSEMALKEKVGLLAYSPLAFGTLSGKYLQEPWPSKGRLSLWGRFSRYLKDNGVAATKEYVGLAKEIGSTPSKLALAFVTTRSFVTSNIIGATTMEQLEENIDSIELELSDEILAKIQEIQERFPDPCP